MMRKALAICLLTCLLGAAAASAQLPDDRIDEAAPDTFVVDIEATTGPFEVTVYRAWSPAAADRLYHLVRVGYFDDVPVFRVVPGYVAQFGITEDPDVYDAWRRISVPDEPVLASNLKGRVSFARGGPQTRTTQLFINLVDNVRLDTLVAGGIPGYPPIGEVTAGIAAVDSLNGQYGNEPARRQREIAMGGRAFLEATYPGLDWIISARLRD
ncbi:MAG: peptidylprolyl isomerase [Rhodothermales bacterium]|nr:peptidylprolyl isomerase [Rhodothermales bacterium]MBO6781121.1 peptidylprolyl isomerase [Rhodothermales bacterium]